MAVIAQDANNILLSPAKLHFEGYIGVADDNPSRSEPYHH
jgi:hypothetical protein